MRKLYLYIFPVLLIISSSYYTQTNQVPTHNSNGVVINSSSYEHFYGNSARGECCGIQDNPQERFICTYEAIQHTLSSADITSLRSSYSFYTDGSTGDSYDTYSSGFAVDDVVNVYMVYLNNAEDRRNSSKNATFTFKDEIVGVGSGWRNTLYWDGTRFGSNSSSYYYPR